MAERVEFDQVVRSRERWGRFAVERDEARPDLLSARWPAGSEESVIGAAGTAGVGRRNPVRWLGWQRTERLTKRATRCCGG